LDWQLVSGWAFYLRPVGVKTRARELNERLNNFGDEAKRRVGKVTQQVREEANMKKDQVKDVVTSFYSDRSAVSYSTSLI
jgi:hypothetical protein